MPRATRSTRPRVARHGRSRRAGSPATAPHDASPRRLFAARIAPTTSAPGAGDTPPAAGDPDSEVVAPEVTAPESFAPELYEPELFAPEAVAPDERGREEHRPEVIGSSVAMFEPVRTVAAPSSPAPSIPPPAPAPAPADPVGASGPATRVHAGRLSEPSGPVALTPSQAVLLATAGPEALSRPRPRAN